MINDIEGHRKKQTLPISVCDTFVGSTPHGISNSVYSHSSNFTSSRIFDNENLVLEKENM